MLALGPLTVTILRAEICIPLHPDWGLAVLLSPRDKNGAYQQAASLYKVQYIYSGQEYYKTQH